MSARRSPARRVARVLFRILAGVTALVVLVIAAALIVVHTDWGRDQIRAQVESALADSVNGSVQVGRVEGSVLGELVARDIVITDLSGRPVIELDRVGVELAPVDLIDDEVHVERLAVRGARIVVAAPAPGEPGEDGEVALRTIADVFAKDEPEQPSRWNIRIDELALEDVTLLWNDGRQDGHVEGLAGTGRLYKTAGAASTIDAGLDLRGRWREREAWIRIRAAVVTGPEETRVPDAVIGFDLAQVTATDLVIRGPEITGRVVADVPAGSWERILPGGPVVGAVHLDARSTRGARPDTLEVALDGDLAGAALVARVAYDRAARAARGHVELDGLDASALLRDAPATAVDAYLGLDGRLAPGAETLSAQTLDGGAWLRLAGTAQGTRLDDLLVTVGAREGAFALTAAGAGPGQARLRASATGRLGEEAIELAAARLIADVPRLDRTAPQAKARAAVHADLRARGRFGGEAPRLDLAGEVRARDVVTEAFTARRAELDLDGTDLLGQPAGRARAVVDGVYVGGDRLGRVALDARSLDRGKVAIALASSPPGAAWRVDVAAVADIALPRVTVALGDWKLRTRDVDWIGRGGRIEVAPERVTVTDLRANLEGGALAAAATYYRVPARGRRAGDLDLAAQVSGTQLRSIDRAVGLGGTYGQVDLDVALARRGRALEGSADVALRGVGRIPGGPTLDLATSVTIAPRRITIDGNLAAGIAGGATFGVAVVPPRRMTDARAWQQLERDAVTAELIIPGLDLDRLALILGKVDAPVEGSLDGRISITPRETIGKLHARDLHTPRFPGGTDLALTLAPEAGDKLGIGVKAAVDDVGTVEAMAKVAVPRRPLDVQAWAALDERAIDGLTIRGDDLAIEGLARLAGQPADWHGRARLAVDVAPGLRSATVLVGAYALRGGPLVEPADVEVRASAEADRIEGLVTTRVAGLRALVAQGRLGVGLEALRRGGARVDAAPLEATVRMDDVALHPLLHLVGRRDPLNGHLDLTATARGTLGAPRVEARWSLARITLADQPFGSMDGQATYDPSGLVAIVRGAQPGGGRLRVEARYPIADPAAAVGTVTARSFDVRTLAALAPGAARDVRGRLDGDVTLRGGDPATTAIDANLRLRRAELPVSPLVGTLRDARVDLVIRQQALSVRADGRLGDGRATVTGTARLAGVLPDQAELKVAMDDVLVLNQLQPTVDATVATTITRQGAGGPWRADVVVSNARVLIPEDSGRDLDPVGAPKDVYYKGEDRERKEPAKVPRPGPDQPLAEPFLISKIRIRPVEIRSEELRAAVGGELEAQVGVDGLRLVGQLDAPRAVITLFGRRYRMEKANVRFDGTTDPRVDVRLSHAFPEMTLYVGVTGRASAPKIDLRSEPPRFGQTELLSILLGGEPDAPPKSMGQTATGVASSFVSKKVVDYLGSYLPIDLDVLSVEGPTGGSGAGASLTVGKWINRALFVAYKQRLEARPDQNAGEAEVEYWLRPRLVVEGTVGDRGIHGLDLLWTRRW